MKITLLITAFNSSSQLAFTFLKDLGYRVDVVYSIYDGQMIEEIDAFAPDIILSPYLNKFIPKEIFTKYPCYVLHPGIRGDKGAYALDNAIREGKKEWGLVYLQANENFDSGAIFAEVPFSMRDTYKASLYRNEINEASFKALSELLLHIKDEDYTPLEQLQTNAHLQLAQEHRKINWHKDTTQEIIKKIYMSDSLPGVFDEILGVPCYLYGVWEEEKLQGLPKSIIAKRDGAICLGTVDGAVWITHLKEPHKFKLPATYVLKEKISGVKESRIPLLFDKTYKTFYEISYEARDDVAYLCFNFHNGAMNSQQCMRLKYAFEYLKEEYQVIVFVGGMDFFSNGIHLNILEDSQKKGEDGWSNINAMNDLVKSILEADEVVTVASLVNNAAAGGFFMALACDYLVSKETLVLNPHYKTLGLSGSEYHSYTLPQRVGEEKAQELLDSALPISSSYAKEIGLIDAVYPKENYYEELHSYATSLYKDDFILEKQDKVELQKDVMQECKRNELNAMHSEFWEDGSDFHQKRYEFVYKICPRETPQRLKETYA